jgi:hypothetical protein
MGKKKRRARRRTQSSGDVERQREQVEELMYVQRSKYCSSSGPSFNTSDVT